MPPPRVHARHLDHPDLVGRIRPTGVAVLLFFATFGLYGLVYTYETHKEMQRHGRDGIGGGLAVVVAIVAGVASPFLHSSEVGRLYERTGRPMPVSAITGLWATSPWLLILVPIFWACTGVPAKTLIPVVLLLLAGPFVWFVKTNNALNDYWRSYGAR
jgi:hypothetical protein